MTTFEEFLVNPDKYLTTEDEYEYIEQGKAYMCNNVIEFGIGCDNGSSGGIAYYNGEFRITSMGSEPEGQGFGTRTLKYLKEILEPLDITIFVEDVVDESKGFWEKMYERELISGYS